jgi:hypothetical protein
MPFQQHNTYGKSNRRNLTDTERQKIDTALSMHSGFNSIAKNLGISNTKLLSEGYTPTNKRNVRLREKKNSLVNPNLEEINQYLDCSVVTFMSNRKANKRSRILWFNGECIIMCFLATRTEYKVKFFKATSSGEKKEYWRNTLLEFASSVKGKIAIDTNCKFSDSHYQLVHLVKDSSHPYNQIVEAKIGNLKTLIYNNIEYIKTLDIDSAIAYITKLYKWQSEGILNNTQPLITVME